MGEFPSFRFRRKEHLKERDGIRAVFNRGSSVSCGGAKLFVLKNSLADNRICFALPRKFGNAVERNRARRISREAYRHIRPRLKGGYDMVLLVYSGGSRGVSPGPENLNTRMKQLTNLFTKAALLRESEQ
ncbi:MAG: ribonuclease P protein component [Treponema sp.]|jgi:ribonuclease P protein component|nr:ribonuclease P protein component [Treponema sp.]